MTKTTTVTQALSELKTIGKRITAKEESIQRYILRQEVLRDPLDRQGGSAKHIAEERQAINDLCEQQVAIRRAIAAANVASSLQIEGQSRSIADWLVWRREVAPARQRFLRGLASIIDRSRSEAQRRGIDRTVYGNVAAMASTGDQKPGDIVVNLNEQELAQQIEQMETMLGSLDGLLSLANATLKIEY